MQRATFDTRLDMASVCGQAMGLKAQPSPVRILVRIPVRISAPVPDSDS